MQKIDTIVYDVIRFFVQGKSYAIFSMLFGLSFFIQMDNQADKGVDFRLRFLWRMALLFVLGYVNGLMYMGEFFVVYAVLGCVMVLLWRVPTKILLAVALILFLSLAPLAEGETGMVAILADAKGSLTNSGAPFTKGIVFTVTLALMVPGIAYGVALGKYKNDKDVWADISQGFAEMGNYVFMCFFISIFTNFFSVSKMGTVLAIAGANGLEAIGFKGLPLMIGLIIVSSFVNLFIGSASAKWAILAPVFVPMMMLMGYDPALTQIVYRIGDSLTNPLSPLFTYMPVAIGFVRKYKDDAGIGTVIANMIPYSATFFVVWLIQLIVWVTLNLPLGPGATIFYAG
jgi:aminobenzoyl-glutamate transport protein